MSLLKMYLNNSIWEIKMTYNIGGGISGAAAGMTAGAAFGPIGAGIGGAIGALGGFAGGSSSGLSAKQAFLLAQYQAQQEEKRMKNAHQWEVEDLVKAGLNPALSAGGSSAGAIAGNSGNAGNIASSLMAASENSKTTRRGQNIQSAIGAAEAFNKIREIQNQAKLQTSQIKNVDADTTTKMINNELIQKYGDKEHKQRLANAMLQAEATRAATAETRANTERIKQQINISQPEAHQNKAYTEFLEKHPTTAGIINASDQILSRAGTVAGFIGSSMGGKAAISAAQNYGKIKRTEYYNKFGERTGTKITK